MALELFWAETPDCLKAALQTGPPSAYNNAMPLEGISIFCFVASYSVALGLEGLRLLRPANLWRWLACTTAGAGLLAHTFYLGYHGRPLSGGPSSLLFLSWILAIFYLYGSIHHRHQAWGVFVLPVVLGLAAAAWLARQPDEAITNTPPELKVWAWLHFALLLLGAVGLCVGFIASVMYLVQVRKLKHKQGPNEGLRLLSLERLEAMSRRGVNLAFPLLTGGLLIGAMLLWSTEQLSWLDPKVLSTGALWLVVMALLYLRYALHLRGRKVALWTIAAFAFLVVTFLIQFILPSRHHFGGAI